MLKTRHEYGANKYPGVTDVLGNAGVCPAIPGDAMPYLIRGKHVHKAVEYDDKGILDEASVAPEYVGYLMSWRKLRGIIMPNISEIELKVISHKLRVGGTIDRIMRFGGNGYLADFKTGGMDKKYTGAQLAGYKIIYTETHKPQERLRRIGIQLFADGRIAKIVPFNDDHADGAVFLEAVKKYYTMPKEAKDVR